MFILLTAIETKQLIFYQNEQISINENFQRK